GPCSTRSYDSVKLIIKYGANCNRPVLLYSVKMHTLKWTPAHCGLSQYGTGTVTTRADRGRAGACHSGRRALITKLIRGTELINQTHKYKLHIVI
ncbi:hypothetical protein J6590_097984, partial [Homalodisca vitripennis]